MKIQICIGSSCHLKGAPLIIELFQKSIAEHHLEDKVDLVGSFCLGKCGSEGVSIVIDDELITGVTQDNFYRLFDEKVLKKL